MRTIIVTIALLLALAAPARATNCNGPGNDSCGSPEGGFVCVDQSGAQVSIEHVCDTRVTAICESAQAACEGAQASCTNSCSCPACPDVTLKSKPIRCAKWKLLKDGRTVGRRCTIVTERN
jgi:hypothetical protein